MPQRARLAALIVAAVAIVGSAAVGLALHLGPALREKPTAAAGLAPSSLRPTGGPAYVIPSKLLLHAGEYTRTGNECAGVGRKAGARANAQVVIINYVEAPMEYATLSAGRIVGLDCEFAFTLAIPSGLGRYSVSVPGYGTIEYTDAEASIETSMTLS